jgi:hypothetical protein
VREHFVELQRVGHPKWKEVELDQELELWKRDTCSQGGKPEPAKAKEKDLVTALTEILKGKRPSR